MHESDIISKPKIPKLEMKDSWIDCSQEPPPIKNRLLKGNSLCSRTWWEVYSCEPHMRLLDLRLKGRHVCSHQGTSIKNMNYTPTVIFLGVLINSYSCGVTNLHTILLSYRRLLKTPPPIDKENETWGEIHKMEKLVLWISRSLSRFETQDIKTQPQINHYLNFWGCIWLNVFSLVSSLFSFPLKRRRKENETPTSNPPFWISISITWDPVGQGRVEV